MSKLHISFFYTLIHNVQKPARRYQMIYDPNKKAMRKSKATGPVIWELDRKNISRPEIDLELEQLEQEYREQNLDYESDTDGPIHEKLGRAPQDPWAVEAKWIQKRNRTGKNKKKQDPRKYRKAYMFVVTNADTANPPNPPTELLEGWDKVEPLGTGIPPIYLPGFHQPDTGLVWGFVMYAYGPGEHSGCSTTPSTPSASPPLSALPLPSPVLPSPSPTPSVSTSPAPPVPRQSRLALPADLDLTYVPHPELHPTRGISISQRFTNRNGIPQVAAVLTALRSCLLQVGRG